MFSPAFSPAFAQPALLVPQEEQAQAQGSCPNGLCTNCAPVAIRFAVRKR